MERIREWRWRNRGRPPVHAKEFDPAPGTLLVQNHVLADSQTTGHMLTHCRRCWAELDHRVWQRLPHVRLAQALVLFRVHMDFGHGRPDLGAYRLTDGGVWVLGLCMGARGPWRGHALLIPGCWGFGFACAPAPALPPLIPPLHPVPLHRPAATSVPGPPRRRGRTSSCSADSEWCWMRMGLLVCAWLPVRVPCREPSRLRAGVP